jgi:putative exosortase-associated protein (TIGR04073 family)
MLLVLTCLSNPAHAEEIQRSDLIMEKMAYKFSRGVTNVFTCIAELPKQTVLTTREKGGIGWVIGPLKGIGMTAYRAVTGLTETVFFMVPQPGYYNSMIDPEFVWNGWEDTRVDRPKAQ